ncbi:MAG: nitrous oxide-stimulated promoter family protein [Porphyromonadaceae bacterium]|nr:nitrous oxide-stimulated promoter family protein [Porphyromonadaceae bacterium]
MGSIDYEKQTVEKMIGLYCRKKHKTKKGALCDTCLSVKNYAWQRLDRCPFGDEKSACEDCPIHCYKPDMKEKMRQIMRFSGPRMILYHPFDAIIHVMRDKK